ncbi:hypothetical protein KPH14_001407 [Odynerus spinipes]|uniref:T-complex protein 11-like protein 1 n=1 Tax=Odynerus spinipes TaxID=1348599 RepID=A0AAD9RVD1_9HYME|nr:hypothetical protein KPH14_001407 [Odynerus spinipes]
MSDRNQEEKNDKAKRNINEPNTSIECPSSSCQIQDGEHSKQQKMSNTMSEWTGASPPKFVSPEEIIKAANGMTNMALAHEIVVDSKFQLQKLKPDDTSPFHRKVKEIMHEAFWNLLAEQLSEDPPDYTQAFILLQEIKDTLDELVVSHHSVLKEDINAILNIDLIKQQAEKGVLSFRHYANYIISTMGKICAPVRDEMIVELKKKEGEEIKDIIETYKGIMEALQLMRLDLANFTIAMIRPSIVAMSVEYEKEKFAEILKTNRYSLCHTKEWLLRHLNDEEIASVSAQDNAIRKITHSLLTEAYLDLLEWDFKPDAETLMLDKHRLIELRDKTSRLSIIGSILLLTNSTVGSSIQGVASFKMRVKEHLTVLLDSVHSNKDLEKVMPNVVLQVIQDLKATLEEIGIPNLSADLEVLLERQITDLAKPDHKVRSLVNLRIRQFLQRLIQSQSTVPQQVPIGLSSLQEELTAITAQFLILVSHNRSVFGEYYQEIVSDALASKLDSDGKKGSTENSIDS